MKKPIGKSKTTDIRSSLRQIPSESKLTCFKRFNNYLRMHMDSNTFNKDDNYKFHSWHIHWGSDSEPGSEHKMDDKQFDAEAHLVHWNTKYPVRIYLYSLLCIHFSISTFFMTFFRVSEKLLNMATDLLFSDFSSKKKVKMTFPVC